jgi:hypothetical protein
LELFASDLFLGNRIDGIEGPETDPRHRAREEVRQRTRAAQDRPFEAAAPARPAAGERADTALDTSGQRLGDERAREDAQDVVFQALQDVGEFLAGGLRVTLAVACRKGCGSGIERLYIGRDETSLLFCQVLSLTRFESIGSLKTKNPPRRWPGGSRTSWTWLRIPISVLRCKKFIAPNWPDLSHAGHQWLQFVASSGSSSYSALRGLTKHVSPCRE